MTTHPNQCQRVLQRLQRGPATTFDLIMLGICCPTKRISELRKDYEILSTEKRQGKKRVVTYRLGGPLQAPSLPPTVDSAALQRETTDTQPQCANPVCGIVFKPTRKGQRYHSTACRFADWNRQHPRLFSENPQDLPMMGNGA